MSQTHAGGCLCGAVRYEARGAPLNVRVCHCTRCQKAMAGPFFARALFLAGQVSVTGQTASFPTSAYLRRHFCPTCGTRVFAEGHNAPHRIAIALATLDDPNALAPTEHIFVATRLDWLKLDDGLPQHADRAPG